MYSKDLASPHEHMLSRRLSELTTCLKLRRNTTIASVRHFDEEIFVFDTRSVFQI
jgi:hypothetical protein